MIRAFVLWISELFSGDPPAPAGQGSESNLTHQWPLTASATLLGLGIVVALVGLAYRREILDNGRFRWLLGTLRIAALAVILGMMAGWARDRHRTDLADLCLVFDASASMAFADRWENEPWVRSLQSRAEAAGLTELSRINIAKSLLLDPASNWNRELAARYHPRLFTVGSTTDVLPDNAAARDSALRALLADQPTTRLGVGLREVLELQRGRPTAAIILFSDGITTEGVGMSDAAEIARTRQIPLYTVATGSESAQCDVWIQDLVVDDVAFVNDQLTFDVQLGASGCAGKPIRLRLFEQGNDLPLDEQRVPAPARRETARARLTHRPRSAGDIRYRVEAEPLDEEQNRDNNQRERSVRISDESIKVLFVQGYPSYEFRALKTLLGRQLKSDRRGEHAVALHTLLQSGDPEYVRSDSAAIAAFPATRDELFEYDVVLWGDCDPSLLPAHAADNLAEFVRVRSGGLVLLCGPRFTPFGFRDEMFLDLLPARRDAVAAPPAFGDIEIGFQTQPSLEGQSSPLIQLADSPAESGEQWRSLPPLFWMLEVNELKPGVKVLLEHPQRTGRGGTRMPLVTMQYVAAGTVVTQFTDETWRWSRAEAGPQAYERYWEQMIRYLGRSRLLGSDRIELSTYRQGDYTLGEPVRFRARFHDPRNAPSADQGVVLALQHASGTRRTLQLAREPASRGVFEGSASLLAEGEYRAWLIEPTLKGAPSSVDFRILPARTETARLEVDLAELSAAAERSAGQMFRVSEIDRLLTELPLGRRVRVEPMPAQPLWNLWPWPTLFVALLTAEWLIRKRAGLL
ncbi:MAG: VWA domain-containing protein [Planctomycetes bacterium]|nr:VWA domain-containing protein [Planctomycetota bacterium]